MIDPNKTYRTRGGHEVRIYAADGSDDYPIHGAIKYDEGWFIERWRKDGFIINGTETQMDLIEYDPAAELLEEAKRRYPKGTKLLIGKPGDIAFTSTSSGEFKISRENSSWVFDAETGWYVYRDGQWAEIIEEKQLEPKEQSVLSKVWSEIAKSEPKEHTKEQLEEILGYKFTLRV